MILSTHQERQRVLDLVFAAIDRDTGVSVAIRRKGHRHKDSGAEFLGTIHEFNGIRIGNECVVVGRPASESYDETHEDIFSKIINPGNGLMVVGFVDVLVGHGVGVANRETFCVLAERISLKQQMNLIPEKLLRHPAYSDHSHILLFRPDELKFN